MKADTHPKLDPKIALAERLAADGLRGWRWFVDGDWILFEPPGRSEVHLSELQLVATFGGAACVGAVFRATPHAGVYVRFKLADERRFPVIVGQTRLPQSVTDRWPRSVPWSFAETFRKQAESNHSQTLEVLASRGGLGPDEMWLAVHDQPLSRFRQTVEPPTEQACGNWLIVAMQALGEETP